MDLEQRKRKYLLSKKTVWSKVVLSRIGWESTKQTWNDQTKSWETHSELYWEIEEIIDERIEEDGKQYVLIKWKNWPSRYNTWEPIENLNDELPVVLKSIQKHKKNPRKDHNVKYKNYKGTPKKCSALDSSDEKDSDAADERITNNLSPDSTNRQESPMEVEVTPQNVAIQSEESTNSLLHSSAHLCENSNEMTLSTIASQEHSPITHDDPVQNINAERTNLSTKTNDSANSEEDEQYCKELEARKAYMLKELSNIDQILMEQEAQISKQKLITDMIIELRKEQPGTLLKGSPYNSIELYDRMMYNYKINDHTCDDHGNLSSFRVTAYNKFDASEAPVIFWATVSDATQKYQREAVEYLIQINKKPDSLSQPAGFTQSL